MKHNRETTMVNDYLALAGGVLLAGIGGELFLRGLVGSARWLRVSPGIIGATVAAFATSSPELAVAISAAAAGRPELSLGDVLGSNVVNVAFILGLALVIARSACPRDSLRRDFSSALLVPVVLGILAIDGRLSRVDGVALVGLFAVWMTAVVREARKQRSATKQVPGQRPALLVLAASVGGLACLFAGGRLIVVGAKGIALQFGIPEFVIGATVVAVGTSVPELATTVIAQIRGHHEIGLGTILGSNIFNCLFIIGLAAVICPISTAGHQVTISLATGFLTVAMTFPTRADFIGRSRGALLLAVYAAYVVTMLQK